MLVTLLNYKLQKNNNFRGRGSRKAKKKRQKKPAANTAGSILQKDVAFINSCVQAPAHVPDNARHTTGHITNKMF